MTKQRLLTIAVLGLLVLNCLFVGLHYFKKSSGRPPSGMPPRGGAANKFFIIDKLQLDSAQITVYSRLVDQHRAAIVRKQTQMRELREKLYATLTTDKQEGKDSTEQQLLQVQREIENIHYNHFLDIRKLCTPKQLPLFNDLTRELGSLFSPKSGPPDGMRQGPPPHGGAHPGPPLNDDMHPGPPPPGN